MGVASGVREAVGLYTCSTDTAPVRTVYNVALSVQKEQIIVELSSSSARWCLCTRAGKVLWAFVAFAFPVAGVLESAACLWRLREREPRHSRRLAKPQPHPCR
jgi:hypothetical protein